MMDKKQLIELLKIEDQTELEALYKSARIARERVFSNKVFIYGCVYFSTWCRNDCNFCYYRKSNKIDRYRKTPEEIVSVAKQLAESGVHLIDLTMGEDLDFHKDDFEKLLNVTKEIKDTTHLPVMISPGVIGHGEIEKFANIGTEWYALYQETHNREIFKKLRINQSYDERMDAKLFAKSKGMLIEEGLLSGVGESLEDIADSMLEMGKIGAQQVRIMSFVPQPGIPMEHVPTPNRNIELQVIAILRLLYPGALIPASLDIDGIAGLKDRIMAGANVVTSIIPPRTGFAGVAQNSMNVDDGGRTVEEATKILKEMGIEVATAQEYKDYIGGLK
ncbi:MAG: methylornithine synthase PylB [Anaerovorax sp.]